MPGEILENMCEEVHFSKFAGLQAYSWHIVNELLHRHSSTAFHTLHVLT